jgi:HPt (histidine-containing phosphotransfer) domain-containing protein
MDTLFSELSHVDGLDIWDGISHMGNNLELFYDVLRQFCKDFDGQLANLEETLAQTDWKNYTIRNHAFKGVFANIGAEHLRAWAFELELAAKNREYDICTEQTPKIINGMIRFRDNLLKTSLIKPEAAKG